MTMTKIQTVIAICIGILIGSVGYWFMMRNKLNQQKQKDKTSDGLKQCRSVEELAEYLDKRFSYHIQRATEHSTYYKTLGCFFLQLSLLCLLF